MQAKKFGLVTVAAFIAIASPCYGDAKDTAAADALFKQGREAMKRNDYATACPEFAESQRLDPAAGTLINLAQCEENSGKLVLALQRWQAAIDSLAAGDDRLGGAKQKKAALKARVPKLTISLASGAPSATKVLVDGTEVPAPRLGSPLPTDPGAHTLVVTAPGHADNQLSIRVAESEVKTVEVAPGSAVANNVDASGQPSAATNRPRDSDQQIDQGRRTQPFIGYVLGGVGIVGLGLGTYFSLHARSKDQQLRDLRCNDSTCPSTVSQDVLDSYTSDSQSAARNGLISFIAGGALLVGGAVLVLTAPSASGKTQVTMSSAVAPGVAALRIGGAW